MPLSEHEQRVLAQMEQALYAEDPKLASTLKTPPRVTAPADRKRLLLGVLVAVLGLAAVVAAVMMQQIWLGGLGFLAMVLGAAWAAAPGARPPAAGATVTRIGRGAPGRQARKRSQGGFMQRMEQQWDRRREQGPF